MLDGCWFAAKLGLAERVLEFPFADKTLLPTSSPDGTYWSWTFHAAILYSDHVMFSTDPGPWGPINTWPCPGTNDWWYARLPWCDDHSTCRVTPSNPKWGHNFDFSKFFSTFNSFPIFSTLFNLKKFFFLNLNSFPTSFQFFSPSQTINSIFCNQIPIPIPIHDMHGRQSNLMDQWRHRCVWHISKSCGGQAHLFHRRPARSDEDTWPPLMVKKMGFHWNYMKEYQYDGHRE